MSKELNIPLRVGILIHRGKVVNPVSTLVTSFKTKEDVPKCFDALQGSLPLSSLNHLKLPLSDEQ